MLSFKIELNSRIASDADIKGLEQFFKLALPQEYRNFLTMYTGGVPTPNRVVTDDHEDCIGEIFSIVAIQDKELYEYFGHPADTMFIPIASTIGGNIYLLQVHGEEKGRVMSWDHSSVDAAGEVALYNDLHFIADNFSDFINCITK